MKEPHSLLARPQYMRQSRTMRTSTKRWRSNMLEQEILTRETCAHTIYGPQGIVSWTI